MKKSSIQPFHLVHFPFVISRTFQGVLSNKQSRDVYQAYNIFGVLICKMHPMTHNILAHQNVLLIFKDNIF